MAAVVKVDVIIAVYNAESTIEESVQSAMDQEIPINLIKRLCTAPANGANDVEDGVSTSRNIHFDVCICCYNDASTDKSLDLLQSLGNRDISSEFAHPDATCCATIRSKLLIGSAPTGTSSRGAGYARNQAARLRDSHETHANADEEPGHHFLCILDSDDIMHPTRIAEQTAAMFSLSYGERNKTIMGCQFDRIPKESTQHYSLWANSLTDSRLYLEQFRECTLVGMMLFRYLPY